MYLINTICIPLITFFQIFFYIIYSPRLQLQKVSCFAHRQKTRPINLNDHLLLRPIQSERAESLFFANLY